MISLIVDLQAIRGQANLILRIFPVSESRKLMYDTLMEEEESAEVMFKIKKYYF